MTLMIRTRMTVWFSLLVMLLLVILGTGIFFGALWGFRRAADQELTSGIDGVTAFLHHKLDIHEMDNLGEELREHSALLPRGKMFRVSRPDGSVVYQPDAMAVVTSLVPPSGSQQTGNVTVANRPYRTSSRFIQVGPYRFLVQVAVDQTEYHELTIGLVWTFLLSVPFAGILSAAAGYWMSGRALQPIHRITETANSIDAHSLSRRLPLSGSEDELDRLSATINRMLERIEGAYERIGQFTADASHELRTPLALVRSNAELLLMDNTLSPRIQHGLSDILSESTYMTRLIGDLLLLARSGEDDTSPPMDLLELNEPLRAIADRAHALAATRNIRSECRLHDAVTPLFGNQTTLEQVLLILVDNAVRYTPEGGSIWIESWVDLEYCGFLVRDTGIGIAPIHQERVFERFFRVDAVRTHRQAGYGLGLSIAKSLVEAYGGAILVHSELNHGSTFTLSFRRADCPKVQYATQSS